MQKDLVKGIPRLSNFSDKVCENFQYGKSHRLLFVLYISLCKAHLEQNHGDLIGPTKTPSNLGSHYMLLFVDNFM